MKATSEKVKVLGTVERVLTGHVPDPKTPYDRFRPWPRVCAPPRIVRRKLLSGRESTRWGRPTSADDPLWRIIGMAGYDPTRPTDVSSNKHKYLAEAYAASHDE